MDANRFDELTRQLDTRTTRRGLVALLAGVAGLGLSETVAKRKRRGKKRRKSKGRAQAEVAINTCAALCDRLFRPGRPPWQRCMERASANQALCECPSFCKRLHPRRPLAQLACLREALEDSSGSLCLACGADPDRACQVQEGGDLICCDANRTCGREGPSAACVCSPDIQCQPGEAVDPADCLCKPSGPVCDPPCEPEETCKFVFGGPGSPGGPGCCDFFRFQVICDAAAGTASFGCNELCRLPEGGTGGGQAGAGELAVVQCSEAQECLDAGDCEVGVTTCRPSSCCGGMICVPVCNV